LKNFKKIQMKKISILTVIIFLYNHTFSQTNGYTLEFEDVVTLSVDALTSPSAGTTITKTYTVPAGMVLKINSGRISMWKSGNSSTNTNIGAVGYIQVDNNLIVGADTSMNGLFGTSASGTIAGSIFRIKPDQPIWVPSNSTVTLGVTVYQTLNLFTLFSNWFSGVLFRKVPN